MMNKTKHMKKKKVKKQKCKKDMALEFFTQPSKFFHTPYLQYKDL